MTREKLTADIVAGLVELTDDRLALAHRLITAMVEADRSLGTARRIDSAALMAAQRAREEGTAPPSQPVDVDMVRRGGIAAEVVAEVERAIRLHGRAMPGGFGNTGTQNDVTEALRAKARCSKAQERGTVSWRLVLEEEVAEVFAETPGSMLQRFELVQVAAVASRWVEAIDAHQAAGPLVPAPLNDWQAPKCERGHVARPGLPCPVCAADRGRP